MNKLQRYVIPAICGLFLLVWTCMAVMIYYPNTWTSTPTVKTIVVKDNETGAEIADILYKNGLVRSPLLFRMALRISGDRDALQSGQFQLANNLSPMGLISQLKDSATHAVKVTIPEGFTVKQIAERLEKDHIVSAKDFLAVAKTYRPYPYIEDPTHTEYAVEGFLFPDTYRIPVGATATDIQRMMTEEMNQKITPAMRKEIAAQGMTIYQFVTLASLVEKEAKYDDDRLKIAAVFKKRLQMEMPLQSCASIQYILGYPKPALSVEDTERPSPYNTYLHKGLPPGPICNPGMKSMEAVLHAPPTEYLYFVADKEGHHHFTKTYEEHLKVVKQIYGS